MSLCSFEGASGRHYDYSAVNLKMRGALPIGGGNYVFTNTRGRTHEVVCVGETSSLLGVFLSPLWAQAKKEYVALTPYIHANTDCEARRLESLDIIGKYHPPMNHELSAKTGS